MAIPQITDQILKTIYGNNYVRHHNYEQNWAFLASLMHKTTFHRNSRSVAQFEKYKQSAPSPFIHYNGSYIPADIKDIYTMKIKIL